MLSLIILFILSLGSTALFKHYALQNQMMDVPNERSSHVIPTPRGGGVAFVICFLLFITWAVCFHLISIWSYMALFVSGGVVALIGFCDDKFSLKAKWRLIGHLFASVFALYCLGGFPSVSLFNWTLSAGLILNILGVLYLTWVLNLYNFMDGIDGIAAVEAITVCLGGALLYWQQGEVILSILPLGLASVVAGFLYWNFPSAKLFMGDVGSGFLGLTLGIMSLQAALLQPVFFWSWIILLAVFITDATITLLVRASRKERLAEAHRSHAYQHASRYFGSHKPVTWVVLLINLMFLLPLALMVGNRMIPAFWGLLIAYIPLISVVIRYNAGKKEV